MTKTQAKKCLSYFNKNSVGLSEEEDGNEEMTEPNSE
jgi:hypothetical protein